MPKSGRQGYEKCRGTCYTRKKMRMRLSGRTEWWGKAMISGFSFSKWFEI